MITEIKNKIVQIIVLAIALLILWEPARAEEAAELSLPSPPQSQLMDTHQMQMGGTEIFSSLYDSSQTPDEIMRYYQDFFGDKKFTLISDQTDKQNRRLKAHKENLVVTVMATAKGAQTRVILGHYLKPDNLSFSDEPTPNWQELMKLLPKEDQSGKDLDFIPRPPGGTRITGITHQNYTYLTYASPSLPKDLREFYKIQMVVKGWELEKELDLGQSVKNFQNTPLGKDAKEIIPVSGASISALASGGATMDFKGYWGKASISILNNGLSGKESGSLVQIKYVKE